MLDVQLKVGYVQIKRILAKRDFVKVFYLKEEYNTLFFCVRAIRDKKT